MFLLEILHDFLLHGSHLREFRCFIILKQNFESSCGLYKHWEISIDFLTSPYKFNNAQSTHMHLMLHRDKKRQILKLYYILWIQ